MAEQKADKAIRRMEREQRKLGKLIGAKGEHVQRIKRGGWS
jgi:hypothetical protein